MAQRDSQQVQHDTVCQKSRDGSRSNEMPRAPRKEDVRGPSCPPSMKPVRRRMVLRCIRRSRFSDALSPCAISSVLLPSVETAQDCYVQQNLRAVRNLTAAVRSQLMQQATNEQRAAESSVSLATPSSGQWSDRDCRWAPRCSVGLSRFWRVVRW